MTLWLLDTNVLSELRRPKPSTAVLAFIAACDLSTLHLSTVTIAEIRYGIELETDVARRDMIESWLQNNVRPMFHGRVLPIDEDVCSAGGCSSVEVEETTTRSLGQT